MENNIVAKRRKAFEKWMVAQFGDKSEIALDFNLDDGYIDSDINWAWVGFNAGLEACGRRKGVYNMTTLK